MFPPEAVTDLTPGVAAAVGDDGSWAGNVLSATRKICADLLGVPENGFDDILESFTSVRSSWLDRSLAGKGEPMKLDYTVLSVAFLTLGLVLFVEILRHKIDRSVHGRPFAKTVLEGVYRELATLGIVEFAIFLGITYSSGYDKDKKAVFALVHFLLFFVAIINALQTVLLAGLASRLTNRLWVKTEELQLNHYIAIREEFDEIERRMGKLGLARAPSEERRAERVHSLKHLRFRNIWQRFLKTVRHPFLQRRYEELLVQVRFHELRVHFLKANNLPMRFKVSEYLVKSNVHVFKKMVHISTMAWIMVAAAVNLFYFLLGMVAYAYESQRMVGTYMTWIYVGLCISFVPLSYLVFNKMKWIFSQIMQMKLIDYAVADDASADSASFDAGSWDGTGNGPDGQGPTRRHAVDQLSLFWGGNPNLVIGAFQFMQLGYAIAASILLIFWKDGLDVGYATVSAKWLAFLLAICYTAFLLILARVIPRYTLCTSLGQLVNKRRLHETLAKYRLEDAQKKARHKLEQSEIEEVLQKESERTTLEASSLKTKTSSFSAEQPSRREMLTELVQQSTRNIQTSKSSVPIASDSAHGELLSALVTTDTKDLPLSASLSSASSSTRRDGRRKLMKSMSGGVSFMRSATESSNNHRASGDVSQAPSAMSFSELARRERKDAITSAPGSASTRSGGRRNMRKTMSDGVSFMRAGVDPELVVPSHESGGEPVGTAGKVGSKDGVLRTQSSESLASMLSSHASQRQRSRNRRRTASDGVAPMCSDMEPVGLRQANQGESDGPLEKVDGSGATRNGLFVPGRRSEVGSAGRLEKVGSKDGDLGMQSSESLASQLSSRASRSERSRNRRRTASDGVAYMSRIGDYDLGVVSDSVSHYLDNIPSKPTVKVSNKEGPQGTIKDETLVTSSCSSSTLSLKADEDLSLTTPNPSIPRLGSGSELHTLVEGKSHRCLDIPKVELMDTSLRAADQVEGVPPNFPEHAPCRGPEHEPKHAPTDNKGKYGGENDTANDNNGDDHSDYNDLPEIMQSIRSFEDSPTATPRRKWTASIRLFLASKTYRLLSGVFGTMLAFFVVGMRVEVLLLANGTIPDYENTWHMPTGGISGLFWWQVSWLSAFILVSLFSSFLFLHPCGGMSRPDMVVAGIFDVVLSSICMGLLFWAETERCCEAEVDNVFSHNSCCADFGSRTWGGVGTIEPFTSLIALRVFRFQLGNLYTKVLNCGVKAKLEHDVPIANVVMKDSTDLHLSGDKLNDTSLHDDGHGKKHLDGETGTIVELWKTALGMYPEVVDKYGEFSGELLQTMLGVDIIQGKPKTSHSFNPDGKSNSPVIRALRKGDKEDHCHNNKDSSSPVSTTTQKTKDAPRLQIADDRPPSTLLEVSNKYTGLDRDVQCIILAGKIGKPVKTNRSMSKECTDSCAAGSNSNPSADFELDTKRIAEEQNDDDASPLFAEPDERLIRSMRRCERRLPPILNDWAVVDVVMTKHEVVFFDAIEADNFDYQSIDSDLRNKKITSRDALVATKGGKGLRLRDVAVGRRVVGHLELANIDLVKIERFSATEAHEDVFESYDEQVIQEEFWKPNSKGQGSRRSRQGSWKHVVEDRLKLRSAQGLLYLRFYSDLEEWEMQAPNADQGCMEKNDAILWCQTIARLCGPLQLHQKLPHLGDEGDAEVLDLIEYTNRSNHDDKGIRMVTNKVHMPQLRANKMYVSHLLKAMSAAAQAKPTHQETESQSETTNCTSSLEQEGDVIQASICNDGSRQSAERFALGDMDDKEKHTDELV